MRTVSIIQARMRSTRLPGKVLAEIDGESMLARVVRRTKKVKRVDEVVVATSDKGVDDVIVEECQRMGISVYRGSEEDVLDRYYKTALAHKADIIVRITADCPLIDPGIIDLAIRTFHEGQADYASNTTVRTFPRGLDTEVFSLQALATAWQEANLPYERAHVTPFIYRNPNRFRLCSVRNESDQSDYRWTVDVPEDLEFVRALYERLGNTPDFDWEDVLQLIFKEPLLAELNRHVEQKSLEEG